MWLACSKGSEENHRGKKSPKEIFGAAGAWIAPGIPLYCGGIRCGHETEPRLCFTPDVLRCATVSGCVASAVSKCSTQFWGVEGRDTSETRN